MTQKSGETSPQEMLDGMIYRVTDRCLYALEENRYDETLELILSTPNRGKLLVLDDGESHRVGNVVERLFDEQDNPLVSRNLGDVFYLRGLSRREKGDLRRSLDDLLQSFNHYLFEFEYPNAIQALCDYASTLRSMGHLSKAEKKALQIPGTARRIISDSEEASYSMAVAWTTLGHIELEMGKFAAAQFHLEEALAIWEKYPQSRQPEGAICTLLSRLYLDRTDIGSMTDVKNKRLETASLYAERAVDLADKLGFDRDRIKASFVRAEVLSVLGYTDRALLMAQGAYQVASNRGFLELQGEGLLTLARISLSAENPYLAMPYIERLQKNESLYEFGLLHEKANLLTRASRRDVINRDRLN